MQHILVHLDVSDDDASLATFPKATDTLSGGHALRTWIIQGLLEFPPSGHFGHGTCLQSYSFRHALGDTFVRRHKSNAIGDQIAIIDRSKRKFETLVMASNPPSFGSASRIANSQPLASLASSSVPAGA